MKKILQGAKKSYDSVAKENNELKNTLKILSKSTSSIRNNNNRNISIGKENTLGTNNQKNIRRSYTKKQVTVNLK